LLARSSLELATGRVHFGEWSEAWGRQAAHILLRASPDVDAIFCGSDQIARGVADALREGGRRIPADIALIGYDNWEVIAAGCRPPLTTVDMDLAELGRFAAEKLLAAIGGAPAHGLHRRACRLVVRDSTGMPAMG
jgi:LacI family transcriptional regulator